ncbi:MAG: AMP-binding protein [Methylohalobius crimeensis]
MTRAKLDTLIDTLERRGDQALVQVFTAAETEKWSYRCVGEQVQALARRLRERIESGEAVALLGTTRPEWIVAAFAVLRAGGVVTPLDTQLADDTLRYLLKDSGARWVFTTAEHRERVGAAAPEARIVLLDAGAVDRNSWRALAGGAVTLPENHADDPAALFYTSGTTGLPKGVPLSHRNMEFQLDALARAGIALANDRVLLPLPLHHVYPFVVGLLTPISLNLTLVLPYALTGPQLVRAIREGEVTVVIGVPRLYAAMFEGISARAASAGRIAGAAFQGLLRLSRTARRNLGLRLGKKLLYPLHRQMGTQLRVLASGGAALDPDLAWNLESLGWQVAVGYGLTETAPILTIAPPDRTRPGAVGHPVPGIELRIDRKAAGAKAITGNEGEIQVRGPNVFTGYRNRPEETRAAFTPDGWFRTGDLGWLDEDGYLHITGRLSTLIVTEGGENIQPDDLEARYAAHPAVEEIGILQHEGRLAALVLPAKANADEPERRVREAIGEIAAKLPSYQRLVDIVLTRKPLPRTRLGKIKRDELVQRFQEARAAGVEPPETAPLALEEMAAEDRNLLELPAARATWQWLAERYPKQGLTPDTRLQLELGVDSLEWLNLTMEIGQRTGIELDDEAIGRIETVRDLLREVLNAAGRREQLVDPLEAPERALNAAHRRWLRRRGLFLRPLAIGLHALIRWLMHGLFRLRVFERQRLPESGPLVLVCNHASYLDPFAVAAALPWSRLHALYWGGWTGVAFTNPVTRFGSRIAQIIPIDPKQGVRASLALSAAVLARDRGLILFPEGQRSPNGQLQPFRPGIGMLLERYPVPVIVASIHGSHEAWPPDRNLPRLHPLTIHFGEVLDPRRLAEQGRGDNAAERIVDALAQHMRELTNEADRQQEGLS